LFSTPHSLPQFHLWVHYYLQSPRNMIIISITINIWPCTCT
jgi:hypothetical protein